MQEVEQPTAEFVRRHAQSEEELRTLREQIRELKALMEEPRKGGLPARLAKAVRLAN